MKTYSPRDIEPKWQKIWADTHLYAATDGDKSRPKYYMLTEFPYPSGEGLHAGHAREYTIGDVIARYKRMQGHNVLFPMGWDAFGLPTENFAIKHKIMPQVATANNVATFRRQMDALGLGFDWSREIKTTDPGYYKWTQWLFLQFYKAGLAYQDEIAINWCPKEKTGLANEEVVNGVHERCGTPVEKKLLKQWLLKITAYADRLIDGLKTVDFPPRIADQQINWIGRSEGAEIDFAVQGDNPLKRVVLLHGKDKGRDDIWYPWLGREATKAGLAADSLNLTTESVPKLKDWTSELTQVNPDEHTVLVGHSRGGVAILRWLELAPAHTRVGRVVLVAANRGDQPDQSGGDFFAAGEYDFAKIRSHCDDFVVVHSRDDQWVPFAAGEHNAAALGARLVAFDHKNHFGQQPDGTNLTEFPELLELVTAPTTITVFTTRADTLAGATFLVLAPEHPLVPKITAPSKRAEVEKYVRQAQSETELERQETERPKTGVFTGAYSENPITKDKIPIWVADYVLAGYGTGAIMAVPAHDERDFAFARTHDLPIIPVLAPEFTDAETPPHKDEPFHEREVVEAFVKHPTEDKYLLLFKKTWQTESYSFPIGGPEKGESLAEAAMRELKEETGYDDIKSAVVVPVTHWVRFYHEGKKLNRLALVHNVAVELASLKQAKVSPEESALHDILWLSQEEILRKVQGQGAKQDFSDYLGGRVFAAEGKLINSGQFNGLAGDEAKRAVCKWLVGQGLGRIATKYRLRDWVFSRQHYWGEPIPVIHCPADGVVPVPDDQLPVTLPEVEHYEPTDTGESPLAAITDWVNVKCPRCGGPAKRETDTMPNWAGSSWYYLRYADPHNDRAFADPDKLKYWLPVDLYLGGMEHTTLHLLYSRFWHQFLYDQKLVPTPEPYAGRRGQGIVLAQDGRKMSKSLGNVINPTDIISRYGADAFRLYILFMAPYDETTPWSDERLNGVSRFLYRVWALAADLIENSQPNVGASEIGSGELAAAVDRQTHKTLKKVHDDLGSMRFNTMVSTLMEYVNFLGRPKIKPELTQPQNAELAARTVRALTLMLAPSAPHIAEELWHAIGEQGSVHVAAWPAYDPKLTKDDIITVVVQVNGKVRGEIAVEPDIAEAELINRAVTESKAAAYLVGKAIQKTIVVPRKLVNFVVK